MAGNNYTAVERAKHATLNAAFEDVVNFTALGSTFEVKVLSTTAGQLWVRWDNAAAVVGADECTLVESNETVIRSGVPTKVVRVISSAALEYVIERLG